LKDEQVAKIEAFLAVAGETRVDVLDALTQLFEGVEGAEEALGQVTRISDHLHALGYGDDRVKVDPSIARGLAYYTGPVFEADLEDAPQFGSMFSGGRYDGLVSRFSGEQVPATGASVGVDRLLAALDHLGQVRERKSTAQVLVCNMDADLESEVVALTWELRRAGIAAELFLGGSRSPGKQLKYADRCGLPLALLYGSQEKEQGIVQIKDLDAGRRKSQQIESREEWIEERPGQREVPRGELVATLRELLGQIEGE
jgi:histidyl-tRNA synthetase